VAKNSPFIGFLRVSQAAALPGREARTPETSVSQDITRARVFAH